MARGRHAPVTGEDQARLIAAMLENPAEHAGKIYPLFGPVELSEAEIAARMSEVLGRKIGYRPATAEAYTARLKSFGLDDFIIQHFLCIAEDCRNGVFAGHQRRHRAVHGNAANDGGGFRRAKPRRLRSRLTRATGWPQGPDGTGASDRRGCV